jgi:hypothetical protein
MKKSCKFLLLIVARYAVETVPFLSLPVDEMVYVSFVAVDVDSDKLK